MSTYRCAMVFRDRLFKVVTVVSLLIAMYHLVGIFFPINESPPWRHAVFVIVCIFCAYGFIKRPTYFIYLFAVLFLQQFFSHGQSLVFQWSEYHKIDWVSFMLLIFMPFPLICLVIDRLARHQ